MQYGLTSEIYNHDAGTKPGNDGPERTRATRESMIGQTLTMHELRKELEFRQAYPVGEVQRRRWYLQTGPDC